jgi:hypothetical protein
MDESTRNDYFWLTSDPAERLLRQAMDSFRNKENVVRIARLLRQEVSNSRAAIVMEQAQLRLRAFTKFQNAEAMFFTRRGLEQASGHQLARYKAEQFARCHRVADICCGIGGDLIALHCRGGSNDSFTKGVDADELTATFARHNLEVCSSDGQRGGEVLFQNFEDTSLDGIDGLHADPDRRGKSANYNRTVQGKRFEPSLESVFDRTPEVGLVAVKVAPATPASKNWPQSIEREWIGDRRECKQQVIWRGDQLDRAGHRTATCVNDAGAATRFSVPESRVDTRLPLADAIGKYIHEPHPTILAAKLGHVLGKNMDLRPLASNVAYMTGPGVDLPLMQSFQVIEVLPLHLKKTAAALRSMNVGMVEVKRRGVEQVAGDQFMKLKLSGSERVTVILTRLDHKRIAIIGKRVSSYFGDTNHE